VVVSAIDIHHNQGCMTALTNSNICLAQRMPLAGWLAVLITTCCMKIASCNGP
jgi:hypothetical protein